jgi:hypothetical protein
LEALRGSEDFNISAKKKGKKRKKKKVKTMRKIIQKIKSKQKKRKMRSKTKWNTSNVVFGFGCSSEVIRTFPFFPFTSIGAISTIILNK